MKCEHAPFNTAVFFDIENLLGGYNFSPQLMAGLSLREIINRVKDTGLTGEIAVKRAYANWSDPRLSFFRNEINELGIDPIQVFGFSWGAKRNAADIQLAIDAIDLAHLRPAITNFVIVSGDGGFASLAKKLHEYGRTVIGAAYRDATNQTLRAVCDDFVWIEAPDEEEPPAKDLKSAKPKPILANGGTSAKTIEDALAAVDKVSMTAGREEVLATVRKVIHHLAKAPALKLLLDHDGIPITVIGQALRLRVDDLDYASLGFPKLTGLLCHACTGTKLQIARRLNGENMVHLVRRNRMPTSEGWEAQPDLSDGEMHTEVYYRAILAQGVPTIRLPGPAGLRLLAVQLSEDPPGGISLASAIETTSEALQGRVSAEHIRQGMLTLLSLGAFVREPENVPLAEQVLTLRDEWRNPEEAVCRIHAAGQEKIIRFLGKVDATILGRIL
jgi:uncharacterized LabA/DUF88 family protein